MWWNERYMISLQVTQLQAFLEIPMGVVVFIHIIIYTMHQFLDRSIFANFLSAFAITHGITVTLSQPSAIFYAPQRAPLILYVSSS